MSRSYPRCVFKVMEAVSEHLGMMISEGLESRFLRRRNTLELCLRSARNVDKRVARFARYSCRGRNTLGLQAVNITRV
jgi:hypothetical protein